MEVEYLPPILRPSSDDIYAIAVMILVITAENLYWSSEGRNAEKSVINFFSWSPQKLTQCLCRPLLPL